MTTVLRIGPADHGRPMTLEEFDASDYEGGYKYELINGKLYVSYEPDVPQNFVEDWLVHKLKLYSRRHPEVINYVTNKARVFLPGRSGDTIPEPDLAAYRDFPFHQPLRSLHWQDLSPVLVAEILSADDPGKDLVRNVKLYLQVPTIKEYWILDTREDPERPTMTVYRRRGRKWTRPIEVSYGESYTTKLLPGFKLVLDPRR